MDERLLGEEEEEVGLPASLYGSMPASSSLAPNRRLEGVMRGTDASERTGNSSSLGQEGKERPALVLVGPHGAGKTSIRRVIFHKLPPHESIFLEPTELVEPELVAHTKYVQFELWDLPGEVGYLDGSAGPIPCEGGGEVTADELFAKAGAVLLVVDGQTSLGHDGAAIAREVAGLVARLSPGTPIDLLLHKMDSDLYQTEERRLEAQAAIEAQVSGVLSDAGLADVVALRTHQTSLFDHSVLAAVSRAVQRLIGPLAAVESALDRFRALSGLSKAFLVDVVTRLQLSADTSIPDDAAAELCADTLDVLVDVSCIYGRDAGADYAFDNQSDAAIRLRDGSCMLVWSVGPYLALAGVVKEEATDGRLRLISCNVRVMRDALRALFQGADATEPPSSSSPRRTNASVRSGGPGGGLTAASPKRAVPIQDGAASIAKSLPSSAPGLRSIN